MRRIFATLALCFLTSISAATAITPFALYSDTCWHVEAGDLLGYRIGIIRLPDDSYVFLQGAGGDWTAPYITKASAADLKRGKLVFTISDNAKLINFRGSINDKIITGKFDGWRDFKERPLVVHLKRIPVSKRGAPNCR